MTRRAIALTLLTCALWASVGIAIKLGLSDAPPLGLGAVRMALAAAALGVLFVFRPPRWDWAHGRAALIATALCSLLLALTHIGFNLTSAARGIVLLNTTPLFVALFAPFFAASERLGAVRAAGLVLAFVGVIAIFAHRLDDGSMRGDAIMVLAAITWSFHTLWTKRARLDPAALTLIQFVGAAAVLGVVSLAVEGLAPWRITAPLMIGVLYLALAGTVLAWLIWAHVLSQAPATSASALIFTVPLFGVALGWLVLGEPVTAQFVLGAGLISLGIVAVTRGRP